MTDTVGPNMIGMIVPYTNVTLNVGNQYENDTATFRPKQSGLYYFSYSGMTYHHRRTCTTLTINGEPVVGMNNYGNQDSYYSFSSQSAIVHLNAQDWVSVALGPTNDCMLWFTYFHWREFCNSFRGFLLKAT